MLRGLAQKIRNLWMRTRKQTKKEQVCGQIYCIMHNHTVNTFGYCASLISVKESESFLICKIWSQIQEYILVALICKHAERNNRDGWKEGNDSFHAGVRLLPSRWRPSTLRAQYQRGITKILQLTS